MDHSGNIKHVFPGSNTAFGFYSLFSHILSPNDAHKIYVIKGGPGTGKSSFMKRIGNALVEQGIDVEFHHCSSDPNSLDCVCIPSLKVALFDGTAPHVIDPCYPGVVDHILNFGALWDTSKLIQHKEAILAESKIISSHFKKAYFYLAAAKNIYDNLVFTEEKAVDENKKLLLENSLIHSIFDDVSDEVSKGSSRDLFSSAITPEGFIDYLHTIIGKTKYIHFLKESFGCHTKELMMHIKELALQKGLHIECYHSPIDPDKIEDILIPSLDSCITTSHFFHKAKVFPTHIYDFTACLDQNISKNIQLEVDRDKKLMLDLFDKGIASLSVAKKLHDNLEQFYISSIDFNRLDVIFEEVLNEILALKI